MFTESKNSSLDCVICIAVLWATKMFHSCITEEFGWNLSSNWFCIKNFKLATIVLGYDTKDNTDIKRGTI